MRTLTAASTTAYAHSRFAVLAFAAFSAVLLIGGATLRPAHAAETGASTAAAVLSSANQAVAPAIAPLAPATDRVIQAVHEGERFTLQGAGFGAGPVLIDLDGPFGLPLGTATAGDDGRFTLSVTMLTGVAGQHTLVARQLTNGQTLQAGASLYVHDGVR